MKMSVQFEVLVEHSKMKAFVFLLTSSPLKQKIVCFPSVTTVCTVFIRL